MKRLLLALSFLIFIHLTEAQNTYRTFNGRVVDSLTSKPLPDATISIYRAKDTLLLNFGFTTPMGNFSLTAKSSDSLIIIVSLLGYNDHEFKQPESEGWMFMSFGDIKMSLQPLEFTGAKVRMSAIRMRGDTIEINATRFKVLPGSDVAQLFKKIPGFEVNVKGEIKVNGSDVTKILVDGSDFFGNNPGMVSKNLNADMVETVQVFDDKNEDGSPKESTPKIINLKLKKGKRNGIFGDILAGYGTENRYEAGGRMNSFKNDRKFSAVINKNNINGTGFDFGFNNWHSVDNYSRNGSSYDYNYVDWGRNNTHSGNINNRTDGGLTYFNEFSNKRKLSFNLNVEQNKYNSISSSTSLFALNDSTDRKSIDSSVVNGLSRQAGGDINFSKQFDSTGYFEIGVRGKYTVSESKTELFNNIFVNNLQANKGIGEKKGDNTISSGSLDISYRRNLRKDKRYVFSAYSSTKINDNHYQNYQFQENQADTFNLLNSQVSNSLEWLTKIYGRMPLYKKLFFFNLSADRWVQTNKSKQLTSGAQNPYERAFEQTYQNTIDTLSIQFDNRLEQYTVKPYLSFEKNSFYASMGATFMSFNLQNQNHTDNQDIDKDYLKFLPYISISYYPQNLGWFSLSASKSTNFPTISDLQPVLNLNNNYERRIGNQNLQPQDNYIFRAYGNFQKVRGFRYLYASINGSFSDNYRITSKTQNENGILILKPENASGQRDLSGYFSLSKKITKTFYMYMSAQLSNDKTPMLVNAIKSYGIDNSMRLSPGINFTKSDSLEFSVDIEWLSNVFENTFNSDLNYRQNTFQYNANIRTVLKFGTEISSNIEIRDQRNVPNIGKIVPVWSAYIQQPLGKSNFSVKLTAYDILKQNTQISRYASDNFVVISRNNQLQQYFMFTLVYKIKKMGGDEDGGFVF